MIDEIERQIKPKIKGKLIYLSQFGSHLYGLNTENSDLDFRGVYIPTLDDIILHKDKDEINTELEITQLESDGITLSQDSSLLPANTRVSTRKVDVKIFSLQKFIQLCSKADTNALDLLFSMESKDDKLEQWWYQEDKFLSKHEGEIYCPFWVILNNKDKLINTDRLESPISYAFKQSVKYGLKGERLKVLQGILTEANNYLSGKISRHITLSKFLDDYTYRNGKPIMNLHDYIDGKHVKIDVLDNKGKEEKYLYVCGVQHQFNLELDTFIERIEEKINKEYTSQRTIDASDGNDWKALSHAIRVLLEIKELLDTGNIQFPLKDKDFLLNIKLGKVEREYIDNFFNQELSNILERVQKNELNWKYDEEFWNEFILKEVKQ